MTPSRPVEVKVNGMRESNARPCRKELGSNNQMRTQVSDGFCAAASKSGVVI